MAYASQTVREYEKQPSKYNYLRPERSCQGNLISATAGHGHRHGEYDSSEHDGRDPCKRHCGAAVCREQAPGRHSEGAEPQCDWCHDPGDHASLSDGQVQSEPHALPERPPPSEVERR